MPPGALFQSLAPVFRKRLFPLGVSYVVCPFAGSLRHHAQTGDTIHFRVIQYLANLLGMGHTSRIRGIARGHRCNISEKCCMRGEPASILDTGRLLETAGSRLSARRITGKLYEASAIVAATHHHLPVKTTGGGVTRLADADVVPSVIGLARLACTSAAACTTPLMVQ